MLVVWCSTSCQAGGGPENVFLLVNSDSRDSKTVANHFVDLRKIPPQNVFYLSWKRSRAITRGGTFRKEILLPALEEISRRKLGGQIDYLIYSCDFPWRIGYAKEFPDETFPRGLNPTTSLTGSTYLWPFVKNERKELFGLQNNFYYAPTRAGMTLTRGFRGGQFWDSNGRRTDAGKGLPYLLSTMLGVTDGRGNSVEEIIRYLESASKADGTKPRGVIYYVRNNSPRSTPRHDLFPKAVGQLALLDVHAEIVNGQFILNKAQVMGVTCGAPRLNIAQAGNLFKPGALGDNLTSAGGNLLIRKAKGPPQTALTEFLRFGAAGACGTVIEPLNYPQKFPSPFLHVHYAKGCSMAESFYQSIAGPYQQLIVGDPLCQPWADRPEVSVGGFQDDARVSGKVTIIPSAKTSEGKEVAYFELFENGRRTQRCPPGGNFSLDTMAMADGVHELRVVATDNTPIETQGRWMGNVMVKNKFDAVQLVVDDAQLARAAEYLTVGVASSREDTVKVFHNGRELGSVAKGAGSLQIPVETLGSGPVTLHAESEGESKLRSRPLRIIVP